MKRLILLLGILSMGFQCDEPNDPIINYGVWLVKNTTSQTLMITPGQYDLQPSSIAPGGTMEIHSQNYRIWNEPDFAGLVLRRVWDGWADENISFEILSNNGSPLVKWNYVDRDLSGRQFFNESSWSLVKSRGEREDELKKTWIFEIKPDDI